MLSSCVKIVTQKNLTMFPKSGYIKPRGKLSFMGIIYYRMVKPNENVSSSISICIKALHVLVLVQELKVFKVIVIRIF